MSDDAISRAAAIKTIRENGCLTGGYYSDREIEDGVVSMLEDLPTIEPQVVHCRECRHWIKDYTFKFGICKIYSKYHNHVTKPEHSCSDGARMDGGEERT